MLGKYRTGLYIVWFFDKYGTKLKERDMVEFSHTKATELGRENASDTESFIVMRVTHNSLDERPG